MTGASTDGSLLYFFGLNSSSTPVIQKFSTAGATSGLYGSTFPGLGTASYDIAWQSGGVWIARDNADSPILAYSTTGELVDHIDGSLISAAAGITKDDSGFLWVSNPDNDTIYQLDVTTGIEEGGGTGIGSRELELSGNPFTSAVVITAAGFDAARMEIFDMTGRTVEAADFTGSYTWDGSRMPSGAYIVRVSDSGGTATARMMKID